MMRFYSTSVCKLAASIRSSHPEPFSFLEESVHLMLGSGGGCCYFFDTSTMILPTFPLMLEILVSASGAKALLIPGNQRTTLHYLAEKQENPNAAQALEALNGLNAKRPGLIHLMEVPAGTPFAAVAESVVRSNPGQPFCVVTHNATLAGTLNAMRFFSGRNINVLFAPSPEKKGEPTCLLRRNTSMPELPAMAAEGKALDTAQSSRAPAEPLFLDGKPVTLPESDIGLGGEAQCYLSPDGKQVYKIFHHVHLKDSPGAKKIEELCALGNRSSTECLCLPQKVILDANGCTAGYAMRKAGGDKLSTLFADSNRFAACLPDRMAETTAALALTSSALRLMYHGLLPHDLSESNVLLERRADGLLFLTLIDLDSCQIKQFPCTVGTDSISPPWRRDTDAPTLRGPEDVSYALCVLCFRLLVNGLHPCGANGSFVFARRDPSTSGSTERYFNIYSNLPYSLKMTFKTTFSNTDPAKQPSALELFQQLLQLEGYLHAVESANCLWPEAAKAATETARCTCCGKEMPANYLVRFGPDVCLCRDCRTQPLPFPMICPGCGQDMGLNVDSFLFAKTTLPLLCKACSAVQSATDPDRPLSRPITAEERAKVKAIIYPRRTRTAAPAPKPVTHIARTAPEPHQPSLLERLAQLLHL